MDHFPLDDDFLAVEDLVACDFGAAAFAGFFLLVTAWTTDFFADAATVVNFLTTGFALARTVFWASSAIGTMSAMPDVFAPAMPPITAPTAAPKGPSKEPAAAPAAAPPATPKPEAESSVVFAVAVFDFAIAVLHLI